MNRNSSALSVGVVIGSKSDWPVMSRAIEQLEKFSVAHEYRVVSRYSDRLDIQRIGQEVIEDQAESHLVATREAKKYQIEDYFKILHGQISVHSTKVKKSVYLESAQEVRILRFDTNTADRMCLVMTKQRIPNSQ